MDLILASDVQTALPNLTSAQVADLPGAISAASTAIERACRRGLALTSYDKIYRPGRYRRIMLDTAPVTSVRLRTDVGVVMTVQQNDKQTNQAATVTLSPTTYTLWRIASGVPTSNVLQLSNYQTVNQLAAAINAIGQGWTATVQNSYGEGYSAIQCGLVAISELSPDYETVGALLDTAELRTYFRDINRYALTNTTNFARIELTENIAQAYRYADRAYGLGYGSAWSSSSDPRYANVRAQYMGGYAVQLSDIAAGVNPPVPDDLKRGVIMAIQNLLDTTPSPNVKSESDGTYTYSLADTPVVLSRAVLNLIGPYIKPLI